MKRVFSALLVCLLLLTCLLPACAFAKAKQMNDDVPVWAEETVRQYMLDYIAGKDMSRLWGYYDLQIRRYMPLSAYENILNDMEWLTGAFVELGSYRSFSEPDKQLKTHVLHLCMEKQDLDLYFTHKDKADDWEVMALQFVPSEKENLPSGRDLLVDGELAVTAPVTYTETEVTVGTEQMPLEGVLTLPKEAAQGERVPGCVLVHDRGPLDKDETQGATTFFADLAHMLADMGVATLRYDKRTYTYGEEVAATVWEETVEDAILAGKLLKENSAIDPKRVVVVGHGLGAMLAPRIASQSEGVFTALLMIGGTPKTYAKLLLDEADLSALSTEEKKALRTNVSKLAEMSESAAGELTLFGKSGSYFWEMEQYDPVKLLKKLKLQTLIVQGKSDPVISEDDGWRLYSEEIGDGISYIGFKSFRSLNHMLMNDLSTDADGVPQYAAAATLDKAASRSLAQWMLSLYQTENEE